MKFAALVSGGKDSIYSILECHRQGHELVACVHLGRPLENADEESYMYQTAASEVLKTLVEDCLQVPLVLYTRKGKSLNTSLVYEEDISSSEQGGDEVEDLYHALRLACQRFPQIEAVSSGAILSTYQRVRIENVCGRLGLTSLSFLWRRASQHDLLQRMLDDGIVAILVRTAAPPGLVPRKHLNKTLNELQQHFHRLHELYQFHVCGEGGEFETLVLDSPLHRKRLVLDQVEVMQAEDGTGNLLIRSCHAEPKTDNCANETLVDPVQDSYMTASAAAIPESGFTHGEPRAKLRFLPYVNVLHGGLLHVSEIMSPEIVEPNGIDSTEAELSVVEVIQVLEALERALQFHGCTPLDVLMVHLYLSEMSHFRRINDHYRKFFGITLPPSRSCVAVGRHRLPGERRVLLDCLAQRGSGRYMRTMQLDDVVDDPAVQAAHATRTSKLRDVLHVQSRSHWAPVCVGPYSQANTLRSVVHFLAGQIGLEPASMTLRPTWTAQLAQAWRNVAQVLDALEAGTMDNLLSAMVYVSDSVGLGNDTVTEIDRICREQIETNSGIVPGAIEKGRTANLEGYEDEETMRELSRDQQPKDALDLLVVSIPEMPVGAAVEVEVITATSSLSSCVKMTDQRAKRALAPVTPKLKPPLGWDTGHTLYPTRMGTTPQIEIDLSFRSVGSDCVACSATTTASVVDGVDDLDLDVTKVCQEMILFLKNSRTFNMASLVNLRVFYVAKWMDATTIRSCFQAAAGSALEKIPAMTFVPVSDMCLLMLETLKKRPLIAFQANSLDAVRTETYRWIHQGR